MKRQILNNRGFSAFGVMIALLTLGVMGMVAIYESLMGETSKVENWRKNQAFYIAQAGVEYSLKEIYLSNSPVIAEPGKSFANGSFIVSFSDPVVTVTGRLGSSNHVIQYNTPSQADCLSFNTATAQLDGNDKIHHIYITKICYSTIIIDKMTLSWNPNTGQKVTKVRIDNDYVYNNPLGAVSGTLLELTNYTVTGAVNEDISKIEFDSNINTSPLTEFTLTVTFADASTTSAMVFTPP